MRFLVLLLVVFSLKISAQNFAQYVNPFIGTGGHGHTFPGAVSGRTGGASAGGVRGPAGGGPGNLRLSAWQTHGHHEPDERRRAGADRDRVDLRGFPGAAVADLRAGRG